MKRHIFIVLPAPVPAGPVKGAYALANALAEKREVTVVTLKAGGGAQSPLHPAVRQVSLAPLGSGGQKRDAFRRLLREAGGAAGTASISMCFSADWLNMGCGRDTVTCSSVRGNLFRNYRMDYGMPGLAFAMVHLVCLRRAHHVVAMTHAMARQVSRYAGSPVQVVGNFVDESALEPYRAEATKVGPLRCVFVGSLGRRKQPLSAVRAIAGLRRQGVDVTLDLLGGGSLQQEIEREAIRLEVRDAVRLHGFLADPYPQIASAHALILPSLSEGISRACLEALHLGVPCVLRAVDGNSELIQPGVNGALFETESDLPRAVLRALEISRPGQGARSTLLPPGFRQHTGAMAYLDLVEG